MGYRAAGRLERALSVNLELTGNLGVWVALGPRHPKGAGLWGPHGPACVGVPTRSSITCQTCLSSWFSFQIP
jgi:hypothetical protein